MAQLHELVTPESIRLDARAHDWRSAIRAAGKLLAKSGAGSPAFTKAMIKNVEEHGPYIVIAPGFAFAHAQAPDLVSRTAMSWARLKKPVKFGNADNDPVTLVAALASADSTQHIQAMRQLMSVVENQETRQQLETASNVDEFLAVLKRLNEW
ncbi:PTS sugar transporter subunit IIA [Kocuria sp. JC486]|uniref:PTS sugar transporter subunit IIA n=1 Tax=Kocuria sp. JC486 TaxID=1970736 RepID=UPI0014248492|nr:PTS sugar transporter subunit IIA [Kocuria sp. JC486]NHU84811.1 PTS sugar transporter subunit IIA [Kocuria sp. JC486]